MNRREFLRLCLAAGAGVSLTTLLAPAVRAALAERKEAKPPLIWLELGSCTGNSISLDNAVNPDFYQFVTEMVDLRYDSVIGGAQGDEAVRTLLDTVDKETGRFWLVVEGTVMTAGGGRYDEIFWRGSRAVTGLEALMEFAPRARYVIAVGDCAAYGGPGAAYPNPGGGKGVWEVVKTPVINIPGCPAHPDWMTGTFSHLLLYGQPELDAYNRPTLFFGATIHDQCQRRSQFENGVFAAAPGEPGCLFKVGCKGPVTHADCPSRQWNHYVNWPVKAGTPCIGCASPQFPDGMTPFFSHWPDIKTPLGVYDLTRLGTAVIAAGVGGVATHLAAGVVTKRIGRHWLQGTQTAKTLPPENADQLKQELDDIIRKQRALIRKVETIRRERQPSGGGIRQRLLRFWGQRRKKTGERP